MSAKAGKRPLRSLTAHEKLEAIRRVHDGESKASVARDIGVPESTLRGWCKNEDKISYLSRQSSPDTDDSVPCGISPYEPKEKKAKLILEDTSVPTPTTTTTGVVAPFNLSLKSPVAYSPNSDSNKYNVTSLDYTKSVAPDSVTVDLSSPMNLKTSLSSANVETITPKSTNNNNGLSESQKNRAELARISVELGLNRPEMFMPSLTGNNGTSASSMNDLTTNIGLLAHQWNNLLMQQQLAKNTSAAAALINKSKPVVAPAPVIPTQHVVVDTTTTSHQQLLNYTNKVEKKLPKVDPQKSVEDSVWYWLKTQQAMLGLTQNMQQQTNNSVTTTLPTTSINNTNAPIVSTTTTPGGPVVDQNSSWFWKWYKQYTTQLQTTTAPPDNKPILYQQLTREKSCNNVENNAMMMDLVQNGAQHQQLSHHPSDVMSTKSATTNKARSVLDNLLLNNNNNVTSNQKEGKEDDLSQSEALEHGEKFLKWLECCSEPSVTAMQIMQFRGLVNNIKSGADRRNGEQKTKVRRK